jgi:ABC-2 type transport system ATP-binding protein
MVAPALAVDGLRKSYPGGRGKSRVVALDGLEFSVGAGTVFGLLGPNGAGKSTAVKILTTLSRPDAGRASVAGVDVLDQPEQARRRIGLVSQKPSSDPMATGRENLMLAARIQGLSKSHAEVRCDDLLDRFGITAAADRLAKSWSGGMARKLDVAIGLVHRPEVLFLDEPTTGLDPEARTEMWAEIQRMADEEAMTVLLTTHYLDEADRLADRLAIIDHGRVVAEGSPDELKSELRGDTVHIELESLQEAGRASARMEAIAGMSDVVVEGCSVRGRSREGARVLPLIFAALEAEAITVVSATVARPSLDDVYLRHAGRAFETAGAPESVEAVSA